jgi:hypothetical protein
MRALVLVAVLSGCGREIVEERPFTVGGAGGGQSATSAGGSAGGASAGGLSALEPGWHDVPADPFEDWGMVLITQRATVLDGTFSFAAAAPAGTYQLAVVWKDHVTPQVVASVTRDAPRFTAALQPPAAALVPSSCSRGRRGTGVLFVLHDATPSSPGDDVVVGSSRSSIVLNAGAFSSFELTYDECVTSDGFLPPVMLAREPRLALALCLAQGRTCADADGVRMSAGSLQLDPEGVVVLGTSVFGRPTLELNGATPIIDRGGRISRDQFRPGRNLVSWRLPGRAAWVATVVLPDAPLLPRLDRGLRLGSSFTVTFDARRWATAFNARLFPIDAPVTRAVYPSVEGTSSPLTGVFSGFPDGRGGVVTGTRATVTLEASRREGRFTFSQVERIEVPVSSN